MTASRFPIQLLGAAVLTWAASAANASMTFATLTGAGNAASFAASVNGGIDTYSDLTINSDLGTASLTRSTSGTSKIGYTVTTQSDLFTVQGSGDIDVGGDYRQTLADIINDDTADTECTAVNNDPIIDLMANTPGAAGNDIPLSTTSGAINITPFHDGTD